MKMDQSFNFAALPGDVLRSLLLGFSGRPHLHFVASVALAHSRKAGDMFSRIAADALLAAWGENPFDGNCVSALAGTLEKLPAQSSSLFPVIRAVQDHWVPSITPEAQTAMLGAPEVQARFLFRQFERDPDNLFWLHSIYEYGRIHGDWKVIGEAVDTVDRGGDLAPLRQIAMGHCAFGMGAMRESLGHYERAALPMPVVGERLAAVYVREGQTERAATALMDAVRQRPWNVGLWLRLYELIVEQPGDVVPDGRTMVLGYSWNKANDLAETLDSLARSSLGRDVHVRILDNGSTDETPEVIRRFVDRYGSDKAERVTMPVNVGAPAARNWLMHLPEVRESRHAAFIDDDIVLPEDWLHKLGGAEARYPDAGVWGCKVVNHDGPMRVQCGEHNLTPTPEGRAEALMSTIMLQDGDFGQADYVRPCASVTGCVHLFRTSRLLENGDFDLRFSPTQYDDLERDLRMVLGGGYAVYTGHLAIPHKRKSGAMADAGKSESANAAGNMHKLMTKYSANEFEEMANRMDTILLADLFRKMEAIRHQQRGVTDL